MEESTTSSQWQWPVKIDRYDRHPELTETETAASSVIYQVQVGAYGRGFYSNDLASTLQAIISETLQANGYHPTPEEGEYRPLPVSLDSEGEADITEKLAAITPAVTEFGLALTLKDLLTAVIGQNQSISEWQAEQLIKDGRVSQALRQLGYQTELTWCQPYHFQPKLSGHDAQQVILKEVRVKNDPTRKLSLAKGLAVLTPALTIDDVDDTLVYLEMIGAKQSVKANWAALVGGGKVHCTDTIVASVPGLPDDFIGPKEEEIIELCLQEKAQGRRVILFCQQTDTLDIQPEWQGMLEAVGLKVAILRAAPNKREAWVEKQIKAGVDVADCVRPSPTHAKWRPGLISSTSRPLSGWRLTTASTPSYKPAAAPGALVRRSR